MMESPVQCGCNAHAAPGFFSLAGTAVKASGTDAQPDAAGSVLRGLGSFPNKQKIAFVSRKPCLQKSAIIIFSMILISGAIRLIQELRAKNAAQQLNRLIHESITVRREGELIEISAEKLVVGDIVLLSAGDRVPADIRLTEVTDLFISQAAITGESAILEKSCRALSYSSLETLTQLENLAFMATTVISGKGEGIVLAVGKDTLYGSFAKPDSDDKKSFQKGANSIAWVMLRFIAVLIPIVFALLGVTGGKWLESFAFALSVAVGLMPEMLPMVITACLARGSLTMSRKQTIIKDINAMQGFGSMDVLCMDKTGTLTNESILLEYYMDVLGNESSEVRNKGIFRVAGFVTIRPIHQHFPPDIFLISQKSLSACTVSCFSTY